MRSHLVLFPALLLSACSSSVTDSTPLPDPDVSTGAIPGCYAVVLGGTPEHDVYLPSLIELSAEQAPLWVEPGHLLVREPGNAQPVAPLSWWAPSSGGTIQLVLGGGYTGYSFSLRRAGTGAWVGHGEYFADLGLEPAPGPLPLKLTSAGCP